MMQELFERHYQAIVERGLINDNTEVKDFINKMHEEFIEIRTLYDDFEYNTREFDQEIIDLMCVCANSLIHYGINIEKELLKNIEKQEQCAKTQNSNP